MKNRSVEKTVDAHAVCLTLCPLPLQDALRKVASLSDSWRRGEVPPSSRRPSHSAEGVLSNHIPPSSLFSLPTRPCSRPSGKQGWSSRVGFRRRTRPLRPQVVVRQLGRRGPLPRSRSLSPSFVLPPSLLNISPSLTSRCSRSSDLRPTGHQDRP